MKRLLLLLLVLTSCQDSSSQKPTEFSGRAMTMEYKVLVGRPLSAGEQQQVESIIASTFDTVDHTYNSWNPDSEISRLNSMKAGETATISPELSSLLGALDSLITLSDGYFDPTIAPLENLWRQNLEKGTAPSDEEIAAVAPAVGWHHIHVANGQLWKDHDLTALDLGGVAKGLSVDLITEQLVDAGYPNTFVEWGGEIRATGRHPEGRPWQVFISQMGSPDPEQALDHVALQDAAIATSGNYYQRWSITDDEGHTKTYTHIINPRTLSPLEVRDGSIASTSVLASSCSLADTLATTAMLFPTTAEAKSWALQLQKRYPDITIWIAE